MDQSINGQISVSGNLRGRKYGILQIHGRSDGRSSRSGYPGRRIRAYAAADLVRRHRPFVDSVRRPRGVAAGLNQNLQPGTYYLGVSAVADNPSGDQGYVLASTFTAASPPYQPLNVGIGPEGEAGGDFNHDGNLDLVVANYDSSDATDNTVSVLLSNGDGTFQPQTTPSVTDANGKGIGPGNVAVGDFRNDGNLDLVTTNFGDGTVSVLLGNGDGTFQNAVTYAVGYKPVTVAVGDFRNNGILDLVVANQNYNSTTSTYGPGTVSVLLGNGDGTFQNAVTYDVGTGPQSVAVGEIDGQLRRLSPPTTHDNTVSVLLGNGDGTFQKTAITYHVGNGPESVALGNFNGNIGIVTANHTVGTVSVLLGNGDGTFQKTATTYTVGTQPLSVSVGQFNGHADIVTANNYSNSVSVLLGDGAAASNPPRPTPWATALMPWPWATLTTMGTRHCRRQQSRRCGIRVGGPGRRHVRLHPGESARGPNALQSGEGGFQPRRRPGHRHRQRGRQHDFRVAGQRRRHLPARRSLRRGKQSRGRGGRRLQP